MISDQKHGSCTHSTMLHECLHMATSQPGKPSLPRLHLNKHSCQLNGNTPISIPFFFFFFFNNQKAAGSPSFFFLFFFCQIKKQHFSSINFHVTLMWEVPFKFVPFYISEGWPLTNFQQRGRDHPLGCRM